MMPRSKCFPDCWPDDQAGHVRASNDGDQQWMKEAMRIKSQALPGTIRNNMWENTGQTGLTSQLCYCYGEESFETEKMLNLIYSYGYFLSSWVFLSVWQWQSFTSLLLFLSAIIKSFGMWRRKSSKDLWRMRRDKHGDNFVFLWRLRDRDMAVINRENMIRLMKFLCPSILQIVTSRLWFHPDNTRHIFHRSPKIF